MNGQTNKAEQLRNAVKKIQKAKYAIAFTGAGISVESGIPPFRGANGIWNRHDPIFLEIEYFARKPLESWKKIKEVFYDTFIKAEPNDAHYFLSRLEKKARLEAIITQNIDNLHQMSGSKNVYELHGNSKTLVCTECASEYDLSFSDLNFLPPTCFVCKGILKPKIVFFNEGIPEKPLKKGFELASKCDLIIVIGTDGEVYPASQIPLAARQHGACVIEINIKPSVFTKEITDIFLQGTAAEVCNELQELMHI